MRDQISLQCTECDRRNYRTSKRREEREKLVLSKYCPQCRRHTEHKETKK